MEVSHVILMVCVVAFTSVGAVYDVRTRRLPNVLVLAMLVGALVYAVVQGAVQGGWSGIGMGLLSALGGFAVGFGTLFVPWLVGGGGGGDVKFAAAVGAWLGASQTFQMLFVAAVLVLTGTLAILGWKFFTRGIRRIQEQYFGSVDGPSSPRLGGVIRRPRRKRPGSLRCAAD